MEHKVLKINDTVYSHYKMMVKGCKYDTKDQVARKLTRSYLMAIPLKTSNNGKGKIYAYGSQRFMVENNTVIWIEDGKSVLPMWYKDNQRYKELTKELGIYKENLEERNQIEELQRKIAKKSKAMENSRKHLMYLRRDLSLLLSHNESNRWILDNLDTAIEMINQK